MRIVYIKSSTTVFGGGSKSFVNMLEGLMKLGVSPLVVFPAKDGLNEIFEKKGIPTCVLPYRMSVYPSLKTWKDFCFYIPRLCIRIVANRYSAYRLASIARQFKPDLIHTNVSVIDIGYRVAKKLNIPHVWHVREYGDRDFGFHYYPSRREFLKRLGNDSYSICITLDIQHYDSLDSKNGKSRVIYNGILSIADLVFEKGKENYFLFAGRLEPNKGIAELLLAFARFIKLRPNSNKHLWIAGNAPKKEYYNYLLSEVERLGISSYVNFLGMRGDVLDLMSKAYLMIVPSFSEGFGRITAEAMFKGALVLGRNAAGTKEQFDNGRQLTGEEIGLRYTSVDELVQRMCEVEDNGIEAYYPMIYRSQQVVGKLYSNESHTKKVYDFYNQILKK